ncbi:MAG: hypothetical protein WCK70_04420 [Chloroflexales bacterium]
MPKLTEFKVSLNLPYIGGIEGTWQPDRNEKEAAWEMYVELVTRVAIVELQPQEGSLREALSSLYSIFDSTRKILREHGPGIAQPKGEGKLSFGYLAVAILNTVLRPLLAKWHPLLRDYEHSRPETISLIAHERAWQFYDEIRGELAELRKPLTEYANLLADVAGIPSLIIDRPSSAE